MLTNNLYRGIVSYKRSPQMIFLFLLNSFFAFLNLSQGNLVMALINGVAAYFCFKALP